MSSLFGVPMDNIMWISLGLTLVVFVVVAILAFRRRIFFRMALRNIPRRRSQTVLIVLGLMLSTLLTTAAFGTGDTMTYTLRTALVGNLGGTDLTVALRTDATGVAGALAGDSQIGYFPADTLDQLKSGLAGDSRVDGVTGWATQPAPVIDTTTRQSAAQTGVIGIPADYSSVYGPLEITAGGALTSDALAAGEVLIDRTAADKLAAKVGDTLQIFVANTRHDVRVREIINYGPPGFAQPVLLMPLADYGALFGKEGQLTQIGVAIKGDLQVDSPLSQEMADRVRELVSANYRVSQAKVNALENAELIGNVFTTIFVAFSLFSIAAGILLIFLIFVMLAAERKPEMGMARAVGAQRSHITMMFIFEGMAYDIAAAAVGATLGILTGWAMVEFINAAFGEFGFAITRHIEPRSVIVAFCLGLLVTFVTVAISAARVSRLNIVAAIRDTPEPVIAEPRLLSILAAPFRNVVLAFRRGKPLEVVSSLVLGLPRALWRSLFSLFKSGPLAVLLGLLFVSIGADSLSAFWFNAGVSLLIIGIGLLVRWILARIRMRAETRDRIAYSIIGIGLLVFWSLPFDAVPDFFGLGELQFDIELFFLAGLMMVAGAVLTVIYNSDILLGLLTFLFGGIGRMAPILKTAVAYPMAARFRTGLTLAMFALIIFVLIVMTVSISATAQRDVDTPAITGGWDLHATVNVANPVGDMVGAVAAQPDLAGKFASIGGQTALPVQMRQPGVVPEAQPGTDATPTVASRQGWSTYVVRMSDDAYLANIQYELSLRAPGYNSDREVWEAIRKDPTLAVADQLVARSGQNGGFGSGGGGALRLQIETTGEKTMQPVPLELRIANSPTTTITIIGVLASGPSEIGIIGGRPALLASLPVPTTDWYFKVAPGADRDALRRTLGSTFLENGLEAVVISDDLRAQQSIGNGFTGLLQGFMGLGLLVGVAALGVISTRAVVERRQQIGMLRAIGYHRRMVAASFLIETSFVALLGILIGVVLGLILAYNLFQFTARDNPELAFSVPWDSVGMIIVVAYAFSLLTTFVPAVQASQVYPAEALRYE